MASKSAFEVPTVQQVVDYLAEKRKDWPPKFIEYYANRFWNHYQSNGWKVSGKSPMKDWHAAINGQWSTLKYREDIDTLNCIKRNEQVKKNYPREFIIRDAVYIPEPAQMDEQQTVAFMDDVLEEYLKHPTLVPTERLASCYDWLKERRLIRITFEQKEAAIKAGNTDIVKGKATIVKFVFDEMGNTFKTFKNML